MGMGDQCHALAALLLGMIRCPLYRRLGGLHNRSEQAWKMLLSPGFDLQTIQLVVSHHTNCAILAHALVQSDATSVKDVKCLGCPSISKTVENVD
jgi:hypothetical protein